ncbi:MAG: DUF1344 domain-containing protein [Deltaproteobacteria bacterium]|nr:DUF1344 domain-containing protein [Deltaproteobacteria bacterium]
MRKGFVLALAMAFVLVFAFQALAKTVEGKVTAIDKDAKTITVEDVNLYAGNVDLSEIAVGDTVEATYKVEGGKNILESITKSGEEEFIPMEGC